MTARGLIAHFSLGKPNRLVLIKCPVLNFTNQFLPGRAAGVMVDILHSPGPLCMLRGERETNQGKVEGFTGCLDALTLLICALSRWDFIHLVLPPPPLSSCLLSSLRSALSTAQPISAPRDKCQTGRSRAQHLELQIAGVWRRQMCACTTGLYVYAIYLGIVYGNLIYPMRP